MLIKFVRMFLMAQLGSFLGCATRQAPPQRGLKVGPARLLPTNIVPGVVVGLLCGGSSFYSLLASYVAGALVGDSLEQ